MIIGITGTSCSGKDTVARYLKDKNFKHYSLSDVIRLEAKSRGINPTRENQIQLGNELRKHFGPSVLAVRTLAMLEEGNNYVLSSVRNLGEIEALKRRSDFHLIFLDALQEIRFERAKKRGSSKDIKTFEEFKKEDVLESDGDRESQQIAKCKEKADSVIINNGSLQKLYKEIALVLHRAKNKRPGWDEYFLEISRAVAKRATCDRGRSGCVIAKDRKMLSTGYVGAPAGLPHCDDVGHLLKTIIHENGKNSQHCVRTSHAEENAIVQAARDGVSLKNSTLYCKMEPCARCAMMIINAGIKKVVCQKRYHAAQQTRDMFKQAGVELVVLSDELETYEDMKLIDY